MVELNKNTTETEQDNPPAKKSEAPPTRTLGLKLFDVLLYPFLTNFAVTGISIVATYLTTHGNDHGKIGRFFQARGDWMMKKCEKIGMSHDQAKMSKMVFFSFADGTLVAPLVKLFEDRREKIAYKIDKSLGTAPENLSAYEAEPKQSWTSVLGGRLATAAIVVPTAVALDKIKVNDVKLNDRLFRNPGTKLGEWVASKPKLARRFGKLNIPSLFEIGLFEAFYTSVCTAGLYVTSRAIAKLGDNKNNHLHAPVDHPATDAPPAGTHNDAEKPSYRHRSRVMEEQLRAEPSPSLGQ